MYVYIYICLYATGKFSEVHTMKDHEMVSPFNYINYINFANVGVLLKYS